MAFFQSAKKATALMRTLSTASISTRLVLSPKPHHVNGAAFSFDAYSSVYACIKIILVLLTLLLVVDIIMVKIKIGGLS